MRLGIVVLALALSPAAVLAQHTTTVVTRVPGAVFCLEKNDVTTGRPGGCKMLPANTTLVALTSTLSAGWVTVKLGPDQGYIRPQYIAEPGEAFAVSETAAPPAADSPCADSLYVELKKRPLDKLTDREYTYMLERDKACTEYQRAALTRPTPVQDGGYAIAEEMRRSNDNWMAWIIGSTLVGALVYLAAFSGY